MPRNYLQGTVLGILAGAWSLQCIVLGGQAGALLQFFQQSICMETPGSGLNSCPPRDLLPLLNSQEQKVCHSGVAQCSKGP